jgi:hypothetical protein
VGNTHPPAPEPEIHLNPMHAQTEMARPRSNAVVSRGGQLRTHSPEPGATSSASGGSVAQSARPKTHTPPPDSAGSLPNADTHQDVLHRFGSAETYAGSTKLHTPPPGAAAPATSPTYWDSHPNPTEASAATGTKIHTPPPAAAPAKPGALTRANNWMHDKMAASDGANARDMERAINGPIERARAYARDEYARQQQRAAKVHTELPPGDPP